MTKNLLNYSLKEIEKLLNINKKQAKKIKEIVKGTDWMMSRHGVNLFNVMENLNEIIGGYGVEHAGDEYCNNYDGVDYVNKGDTYDTTIIYDFDEGKFGIGNWGSYVEYYDSKCKEKDKYFR